MRFVDEATITVIGGKGGNGSNPNNGGAGGGASGAVRIIWPGTTRSFPSTNTGNL